MANTYTQIHIQAIFAVQNRFSLIDESWKESLYKYISGIIRSQNHKLISINGMPDHVHILFGMRPNQSLSGLMKDIKGSSSTWINEKRIARAHFNWQEGYGAFSYGKSQLPDVIRYIKNQEFHHKTKTFSEEYREFLKKFEVDFDDRFILKDIY